MTTLKSKIEQLKQEFGEVKVSTRQVCSDPYRFMGVVTINGVEYRGFGDDRNEAKTQAVDAARVSLTPWAFKS